MLPSSARLLALLLLLPTGSSAATVEEEFLKISECLVSPEPGRECKPLFSYLRKTPHHREGMNIYPDDEWGLREELSAKGLKAPESIILLDYAWWSGPAGEVAVLFDWSYLPFSNDPRARDDRTKSQARWLAYRMGSVSKDYWDGGKYNNLLVYTRKKGASEFELSANEVVCGEWSDRLGFYFKEPASRTCSPVKSVPGGYGVCFTRYFSKGWPELHVWNDERASTGVVLRSYASTGGGYKKISSTDGHYEQVWETPKSRPRWALVRHTTGEGFDEDWSFAYPGSVDLFDPKTGRLEKSKALTERMFPVVERKIAPGTPQQEDVFMDKEGKLFRFVR